MAHENFLWGALRIQGELLMLGFTVSQATVSRYMPARSRPPTQSWRSFLRNQASAFGQYTEQRSGGHARLNVQSSWAQLMRSAAVQIAAVGVGLRRGLGRQQPALNARRISLRSAPCERAAIHRVDRLAAVSGGFPESAQQSPYEPPFRCGLHRMKLGRHQGRGCAPLWMLLFVDQVLRRHRYSKDASNR
jgi:hypothetical protein